MEQPYHLLLQMYAVDGNIGHSVWYFRKSSS